MRSLACLITLLVLCAGMPAALAGTPGEPELTDACGLQEGVTTFDTQSAPGWADICAGWFETVSGEDGPPAIRLTLAFAEDLEARPLSSWYYASFYSGDCRFSVERGDERQLDQLPGYEGARIGVRCGPASFPDPDCPYPVLISCSIANEPVYFYAPEGTFVDDANQLQATLVFAGGLALWADRFAAGAVLDRLYATARGTESTYTGTACVGSMCVQSGGDDARGSADYTVEAGEGPAVTGPIVPSVPPGPHCVAGAAADAGPDRPHALDGEKDYETVIHVPEADRTGYDIKSAWFGTAPDGGTTLSILPFGPDHADGGLAYTAEFNGFFARFTNAADGSWSGAAGVMSGDYTENLPERLLDDPAADPLPVTHDDATGQVTLTIPESFLPAPGGALTLTDVTSWHRVYGSAAPASRFQTTMSVDTAAQLCAATR